MRSSIGKCLLLILTILFTSSFSFGQVWEKEFPHLERSIESMVELSNGDLVFTDRDRIECVDSLGNPRWGIELEAVTLNNLHPMAVGPMASGNIFVPCHNNFSQHFIAHISPQGAVVNEYQIPMFVPLSHEFVVFPNDESIFLLGNSLMKLNAVGDSLWTKEMPDPPMGGNLNLAKIIPAFDGGLAMVGKAYYATGERLTCIKVDSAGVVEWQKGYVPDTTTYNGQTGSFEGRSIVQAPDSSFMLSYWGFVFPGPVTDGLLKISPLGDSLDLIGLPEPLREGHLVRGADGSLLCYRHDNYWVGGVSMGKFDWNGNAIWYKDWDMPGRDIKVQGVIPLLDSGFAVCGESKSEFANAFVGGYLARLGADGNLYDNQVEGIAYYDLDADCIQDSNEAVVPGLLLSLSGDTNLTFSTDPQGQYWMPLDSGAYQISLGGLSSYWSTSACAPSYNLNLSANGDSIVLDFPLTPSVLCPDMRVDISSGPLAACFEGIFWVHYLNAGTDSAANAYVEVSLPPSVTFDSATVAYTTLPSGDLRFELGTVESLANGSFRLDVSVDCPANPLDLLGTTECATAHIYPDSSCLPPSGSWDGSSIEVDIQCLPNDSLRFVIRNTSASAMTSPGTYVVLEDNIMRINNPFQLPGNDSIVFYEEANGATWTLLADQGLGHPTSVQPLVSLEGCGENAQGQISLGIVPQMPQDDSHPGTSIYCATYVGSYDPNDKSSQPTGTGVLHEIETNTELDYLIRFQNEGTYYARDVVVVDTLDPALDWTSLEVVATSHNYTWELRPGGVLAVTFADIDLPWTDQDSTGSQGFIKFSIFPDSSLQPGHRIQNRAAIYFDNNPPIITNVVVHHIATDMFIVAINKGKDAPAFAVKAYPNPFGEQVRFEVGDELGENATFTLLDVKGSVVRAQSVGGVKEFLLSGASLNAGIYFFRLEDGNGNAVNGKLLRFK